MGPFSRQFPLYTQGLLICPCLQATENCATGQLATLGHFLCSQKLSLLKHILENYFLQ